MTEDDPDKLINEIIQHPPEEPRDAELMRRAIDMIYRLRMALENQREELRLSRTLIEKQQRLLMQKGIIP